MNFCLHPSSFVQYCGPFFPPYLKARGLTAIRPTKCCSSEIKKKNNESERCIYLVKLELYGVYKMKFVGYVLESRASSLKK